VTRPLSSRKRPYRQTGLHTAQRQLAQYGSRALPAPDTPVGAELVAWRQALVDDLGGDPSTAQLAVIDLAVRSKLLLDSIDAYLLSMPSLVDKRHRRLWAVVRERQGLADALARYLTQLGLERRAKPIDPEAVLARFRK